MDPGPGTPGCKGSRRRQSIDAASTQLTFTAVQLLACIMNGSGGSVATAPPPSSHPTFLGLKKEEQGKGKDGESQNLGKPVPTNLDEFSGSVTPNGLV